MPEFLAVLLRQLADAAPAFVAARGLPLAVCDPAGVRLADYLPPGPVPSHRPTPAEYALALREAVAWGEPSFVLTAGEQVLWAVPLQHNALLLGGLVVDCAADDLSAERLAAEATALAAWASEHHFFNAALLEARQVSGRYERLRADALEQARQTGARSNLRGLYLLEEPLLATAIRTGDRRAARQVLNRLLVGIHAAAGTQLELVKSFYAELVVTVSRVAVWSGGAPETVLAANLMALASLSQITSEEVLTHWLRGTLELAMDAVRAARRTDHSAALPEAIAYLHEHFREPLTRDQVAAVGCLSPAYFSRQIQQHFGVTFTELLTRLRLDHASELLLGTQRNIADIAAASGFGSASYFGKVFRSERGCSPSAFRANARQAAAGLSGAERRPS